MIQHLLIARSPERYAPTFDNEGPRTPRSPTLMNNQSDPTKDHIRTL